MDEYLLTSFLFLLPLLLFPLVLVLLKTLSPIKAVKLPPSPPTWPVIGNLHQLGEFPHRSLTALSGKHGPLMLVKFGRVPTLVVSCPNVVHGIVKNHDVVFSDKAKATAIDVLFNGGRNMGFSPYGNFWRESRKICTLQLLSSSRVQSFGPVREEEVSAALDSIRRASMAEEAIDLSDVLISTSNSIVSRTILGRAYIDQADGGSQLVELMNRTVELLMEVSVGDLFPGFGWVDVLRGFVRRLRSTSRALDGLCTQVIEDHISNNKGGCDFSSSSTTKVKDFVDFLLELDYGSMIHTAGLRHHQYVKMILQDMILAGTETSSTAICWIMAELLRNPGTMKKLQDEIRRVVGNKGGVETEDIDRMDYFKCVINEVLRLHPPLPFLVPRETSEAVKINGYDIPAKTRVFVNAWAIHRHPDWWDRPEEFIPERFENMSLDYKTQLDSSQYIPFGFGRRICPGMMFGMANVEYLLANLLYWFDWKLLTSPEELDMTETFGIVVHKKNHIYAIPIAYSP